MPGPDADPAGLFAKEEVNAPKLSRVPICPLTYPVDLFSPTSGVILLLVGQKDSGCSWSSALAIVLIFGPLTMCMLYRIILGSAVADPL